MEKMREKKKNTFIDCLKGIAILLVLVGHCVQYGSGAAFLESSAYWNNIVMKVIYSFHMPLFIAISGYLFWFSVKNHGMINSIKTRIVRLAPVCFTWALILSLVDFTKGEFPGVKHTVYYFLTDFWFLWAVIFSTVCVALIEFVHNKFGGGYAAVAAVLLMNAFILTPDMLWLHAYKFVAPYFIGGYYYAKKQKSWLKSNIVGGTSALLWAVLILFYSKDSYIYTTGLTVFRKDNIWNQLGIDAYRYLVGIVGVIAVIWILKKLYAVIASREESWVTSGRSMIEYMGRNSITYYILSTYLFAWIMPKITKNFTFNIISILVETFVVGVLCDVVGKIIKRFKHLSRWLIAN